MTLTPTSGQRVSGDPREVCVILFICAVNYTCQNLDVTFTDTHFMISKALFVNRNCFFVNLRSKISNRMLCKPYIDGS